MKYTVTPSAMIVVEDVLYFSERNNDIIYKLEKGNSTPKCVGGFRLTLNSEVSLFIKACYWDDKIYFVPFNAWAIEVLDIHTNKIDIIQLPEGYRNAKSKFFTASIVNGKIYMFGYNINSILLYDIELRTFEEMSLDYNESPWIHDSIVVDDTIYAVMLKERFLIKIETLNDEMKLIPLDGHSQGYSGINLHKESLWLTPYNGDYFLKVNMYTYEQKEVSDGVENCEWSYVGSTVVGDEMYVSTCKSLLPLRVNLCADIIEVNTQLKELYNGEEISCLPSVYFDKKIIASVPGRQCAVIYNLQMEQAEFIKYDTDEKPQYYLKECIARERKAFMLEDFLAVLLRSVNEYEMEK